MAETSENGSRQLSREPGRIVVMLDASRGSLDALEAAAELAEHRKAELLGLFVEDADLLLSAALPFTREIGARSGLSRPFLSSDLQARLQRQARAARRALAQAAERRRLRHAMHIGRGPVVSQALVAVAPGDMLFLGRMGWSHGHGLRLGSTASAIARQARCAVVIWNQAQQTAQEVGPLAVLIEDLEDGREALLAAAHVLARQHPLLILVPSAGTAGAGAEGHRELALWLADRRIPARIRELPALDPDTTAHALAEEGAWALIVSRGSRVMAAPLAHSVLEALELPTVVV